MSQETQVVGDCHNGDPASVSKAQSTIRTKYEVRTGVEGGSLARGWRAHGNLEMRTYSIWSNHAPMEMARASHGRNDNSRLCKDLSACDNTAA